METEWEATFWPVQKDDARKRLADAGAVRVYPERLMRRVNLYPPIDSGDAEIFARVRDEGDRVTMTVKDMSGTKIEEQKEAEVVVENFEKARAVLRALGCRDKNYQETHRELWRLEETEITIDEWPFLEPFVEIEGSSEDEVRTVAEKLGFPWSEARFCSADVLYAERYGVEAQFVNRGIPILTFDIESPFKK